MRIFTAINISKECGDYQLHPILQALIWRKIVIVFENQNQRGFFGGQDSLLQEKIFLSHLTCLNKQLWQKGNQLGDNPLGEIKLTMNSIHTTIIAIALGVCGGIVFPSSTLKAQTLFSDTLQSASDASNWTINHSGSDYKATFGFDYSTLGIPQDPFMTTGGSTALEFQVNQSAGVLQGVSVSPTGMGFTGNYTMSFDLFCNYIVSGNGSTQVANYGIGTAGTSAVWSVNNDGLELGNILDNGSGTAYRAYLKGSNLGATPFAAGSQNFANSYYTSRFPSVTIPSTETAKFPTQTGSSSAGTLSFQWVQVSLTKSGSTLTESINGNNILTTDVSSLTASNIFLGLYDTSAGSANAGTNDFNLALFDNLNIFQTNPVPEPATYVMTTLGASALFMLVRRSRKT